MDIGWKVASAGALVLAGLASDKIVDAGWKVATGHTPPRGDDELEARLAEILIFAALSGVLAALVRRYTLRGVSKWYGPSVKSLTSDSSVRTIATK